MATVDKFFSHIRTISIVMRLKSKKINKNKQVHRLQGVEAGSDIAIDTSEDGIKRK